MQISTVFSSIFKSTSNIALVLLFVTLQLKNQPCTAMTTGAPASPDTDMDYVCSSMAMCSAKNYTSCGCVRFSDGSNSCACSRYFKGQRCHLIDLRVPIKDVTETGIDFVWSEQICLEEYVVVFTRNPPKKRQKIFQEILPSNHTNKISITGMEPDDMEYILCIHQASEINATESRHLVDTFNVTLPNCGVLRTAYAKQGAFSHAFIGIAVSMCCVVFFLLIAQTIMRFRNKHTREKILAEVLGGLNKLRLPHQQNSRQKKYQEDRQLDNKDLNDQLQNQVTE